MIRYRKAEYSHHPEDDKLTVEELACLSLLEEARAITSPGVGNAIDRLLDWSSEVQER